MDNPDAGGRDLGRELEAHGESKRTPAGTENICATCDGQRCLRAGSNRRPYSDCGTRARVALHAVRTSRRFHPLLCRPSRDQSISLRECKSATERSLCRAEGQRSPVPLPHRTILGSRYSTGSPWKNSLYKPIERTHSRLQTQRGFGKELLRMYLSGRLVERTN